MVAVPELDRELRGALRRSGLVYIGDSCPGIVRLRKGDSFLYRDCRGRVIRDRAVIERITSLVIPPAWTEVWISTRADSHLQATGRDARGRKQYRYHAGFRTIREEAKYAGLVHFGLALPRLRRRVERDLREPGLNRRKVLAAVVRLLDCTHLRVGNSEYVRTNNSHGLSTLFDHHVSFEGATLRLKFRGKSGIWHERKVTDARLARIVKQCRDLPGEDLFQYLDAEGVPRVISSADVNEYLRAATGEHTAKTFRTWTGSVRALTRFRREPLPASATAAKRTIARVIREVAAELGNTPSVCRKSYIHPRVLEAYLENTLGRLDGEKTGRNRSADENRLLKLLSSK